MAFLPSLGLFEGVERLPAAYHAPSSRPHGDLADSEVLEQAADVEEAAAAAGGEEGVPRDGRAPHLRQPEPGHRDPVGVQGQEETAAVWLLLVAEIPKKELTCSVQIKSSVA